VRAGLFNEPHVPPDADADQCEAARWQNFRNQLERVALDASQG
jgi:hypothetical protein